MGSAAAIALVDRVAEQGAGPAADQRADRAVAATGDAGAEQAAGDRADDRAGRAVAGAATTVIAAVIASLVTALRINAIVEALRPVAAIALAIIAMPL